MVCAAYFPLLTCFRSLTYEYLQASGVPHTALIPVCYFGNIFLFEWLTKNHNGDWKLQFPFPIDVPIPSFSPRDVGAYVSDVHY